MNKYRLSFVLLVVFVTAFLSGCGEMLPEETTSAKDLPVSVETVPDIVKEEPEDAVLAASCELTVFGDVVLFIDKTDMLLKSVNPETEEIKVLFDEPVYGEFILSGTKIIFTNAETGMLTVGDVLKRGYTALAQMSMAKGAVLGNTLYFVDNDDYGQEYILYRYDLSSGMWDNRRLSGGLCSPNSETIYFGNNGVWYIASNSDCSEICVADYRTLEIRSVYKSSEQSGIMEFCVSDGKLFFSDSDRDIYYVDERLYKTEKFLEGAVRLYSASSEGVYYQKSAGYPLRLYLGNLKGNSLDIMGGVVISSYGTRCLLRRFSGGQEQLVMVKYPEDSVLFSRECSLFDTVTNGRYVIAFINDSGYLYFFDLATGEEKYFETKRLLHKGGSAEDYYADDSGIIFPMESSLYDAAPETVAGLFLEAVRRNDVYTLDALICEGDYLTPYVSYVYKAYELIESSRTEDTVKYDVRFVHYTDADVNLQGYMPDCLRKGRIVLVNENGLWKVDTNAS